MHVYLNTHSIKVDIVAWTKKYLFQTKQKSQISQVFKSHISNFLKKWFIPIC